MSRAPGLRPPGGEGEAGGEIVELLENVCGLDPVLDRPADLLAEGFLDLPADDEDDLVESRPEGVIDGIIDDDLAVRPDGVDLLEAAVPASDAGGHDQECQGCH